MLRTYLLVKLKLGLKLW